MPIVRAYVYSGKSKLVWGGPISWLLLHEPAQ